MPLAVAQRRYTADELVSVARAHGYPEFTKRRLTDWVAIGLLDKGKDTGRGRGRGKQYTWPDSQRALLLLLLGKHGSVRRPVLCNLPVAVWLLWSDYVQLRQARRALATWADTARTVTYTKAKQGGEQALLELNHPDATRQDRDRLRRLITQAAKTGRFDSDALADAARRVFDPHDTGMTRGPWGLLDADAFTRLLKARVTGLANVAHAPDDAYQQARKLYLAAGPTAEHLRDPNASTAALADPRLGGRTTLKSLEAATNNACLDLITSLGITVLTPPSNLI